MNTENHRQVSLMNVMVIFHSCSHISSYLYTGIYHSVGNDEEMMIHHKRKIVFVHSELYTMSNMMITGPVITKCKGLYWNWNRNCLGGNPPFFFVLHFKNNISKLLLSHRYWSAVATTGLFGSFCSVGQSYLKPSRFNLIVQIIVSFTPQVSLQVW